MRCTSTLKGRPSPKQTDQPAPALEERGAHTSSLADGVGVVAKQVGVELSGQVGYGMETNTRDDWNRHGGRRRRGNNSQLGCVS